METVQPTSIKVSYLDWPAIIAGAVLAAAISFVLLTAGGAIGLSMVSAHGPSHGTAAAYFGAFWAIAVPIGALLAGGYVAGRMRPAWAEGESEGDFRDGIHGALVWSVSVVFGAALALSAAHTAGNIGASLTSGAFTVADASAPTVAALVQAAPAPNRPLVSADQQAQIGRVLVNGARNGALSESEKAYLTQTVAQAAGIPPAEAEKRVTDAYNATLKTVDDVRRASVTGGLITATALLMGLAAAWYAAQRGGNHRDNNRPPRFFG